MKMNQGMAHQDIPTNEVTKLLSIFLNLRVLEVAACLVQMLCNRTFFVARNGGRAFRAVHMAIYIGVRSLTRNSTLRTVAPTSNSYASPVRAKGSDFYQFFSKQTGFKANQNDVLFVFYLWKFLKIDSSGRK